MQIQSEANIDVHSTFKQLVTDGKTPSKFQQQISFTHLNIMTSHQQKGFTVGRNFKQLWSPTTDQKNSWFHFGEKQVLEDTWY